MTERRRVLLLHGESLFCAGAQRMLAYFLEGAHRAGVEATLAMAPNAKLAPLLPPNARCLPLPVSQKFSLPGILRQALAVRRILRSAPAPYEVLHGWTARDWELTSVAGLLTRRVTVGLLHDHPRANHISRGRQRLMKLCALHGLSRTLCVSQAVADACAAAGYPSDRLAVVRNGLPLSPEPALPPEPGARVRLGYLGIFSERKGLRVLFRMIQELGRSQVPGWELTLAGGAQDEAGESLIQELRATYEKEEWWPRIRWAGWVSQTAEFLSQIDLLIVPSSEFDPFPNVLLEAAAAARPVLAARVGGVPEIVREGDTGWLFDPTEPSQAAYELARLIAEPSWLTRSGASAGRRIHAEFTVEIMAAGYHRLYSELLAGRAPRSTPPPPASA